MNVSEKIDVKSAREILERGSKLFTESKFQEAFRVWIKNEYAYHLATPHINYIISVVDRNFFRTMLTNGNNGNNNNNGNNAIAKYILLINNYQSSISRVGTKFVSELESLMLELKLSSNCNCSLLYHTLGLEYYKVNNNQKAIEYLRYAAENNFPPSQRLIADCCENLWKECGDIKFYNESIYWRNKSVENGEECNYILVLSYMSGYEKLEVKDSKGDKANLKLAMQACKREYKTCSSHSAYALRILFDSFDKLNETDKTFEEAETLTDAYRYWGIYISSDKYNPPYQLESFYNKYSYLIDFDREYLKISNLITNLVCPRILSAKIKPNYESHLAWAQRILLYLISRQDSPFHKHSMAYKKEKINEIAREISNYSRLPIVVAKICVEYFSSFSYDY